MAARALGPRATRAPPEGAALLVREPHGLQHRLRGHGRDRARPVRVRRGAAVLGLPRPATAVAHSGWPPMPSSFNRMHAARACTGLSILATGGAQGGAHSGADRAARGGLLPVRQRAAAVAPRTRSASARPWRRGRPEAPAAAAATRCASVVAATGQTGRERVQAMVRESSMADAPTWAAQLCRGGEGA
jgi:hypothetical protein